MTIIQKTTIQPIASSKSSPPSEGKDKVSSQAAQAIHPPVSPATLSDKKVTYTNPFAAFIEFLLNILRAILGSAKPPQEQIPEKSELAKDPTPPSIQPQDSPQPVQKAAIPAEQVQPTLKAFLKKYEQGIRSLAQELLHPSVLEQLVKTKLQEAKQAYKKEPDLTSLEARFFSPENKKILLQSIERLRVIDYYSSSLLTGLKSQYAEQKATEVFGKIYPAYHSSLLAMLENPPKNYQQLKAPLAKIALRLIQDLETPKPLAERNREVSPLEKELYQVKSELSEGKLIPSRDLIYKQHPGLEAALAKNTAQKKQFELILSRAWIQKELKNLSAYQGSPFEKQVLQNLGYNVSSYDDKKFLQEAMGTHYWNYERNTELPSIEELPKEFKRKAFETRVRGAGVPAESVGNLRELISFYYEQRQKLRAAAGEVRDKLVIHAQLPKARAFIQAQLHGRHMNAIENHLAEHLRREKDILRKHLSSPDFKRSSLPTLSPGLIKSFKAPSEDIRKAENWFMKYEGMILSEFSQGEDDENECLGEGVCLSLAFRAARMGLESPDASPSKVAVRHIEGKDRFLQGLHSAEMRNRKARLLPPHLLAKEGFQEKISFVAQGDRSVGVALIEQMLQSEESNGGLLLGWDHHETFMRFDPQRNKFFFFDPNFNTVVFRKKSDESSDESLEELAARMAAAYLELYEWAYPERKTMDCRQIVPLKPGEAVPTGKIDFDKIPVYI
ncbi:MAG: hypothetical protein JSS10_03635 [Verrucomicrobia bacterium]|nr:hypothetical protein [Verrucomicrobiota bacterium]